VLVAVTEFGSVWRRRFSKNEHDLNRFAHGAYFNTTGVMVNGHVRQRPLILGYAKFNGVGGFDPNFPSRMINRVCECADVCVWNGENKLLFRRLLPHGEVPDLFLVVARPDVTGRLLMGSEDWRSDDTWLLAFSEDGQRQEAMLLMPAHGWISSVLGKFVLEPTATPWIATLRLQDCAKTAR
jgi:hypothetical protein